MWINELSYKESNMYWVLMSERSDEYELSIDGLPPDIERLNLSCDRGERITDNVDTIDVPYKLHPDEFFTDNIVAPTRLGLLFNKKVKAIFDAFAIKNIQYLSARLVEKKTQSTDENYYIANVIGKYTCVDKKASSLELFEDGDIQFINKLVLNLNDEKDYGHIFRLSEFPPILIISDSLKTALIQNNVTGFKIYKPELFSL